MENYRENLNLNTLGIFHQISTEYDQEYSNIFHIHYLH